MKIKITDKTRILYGKLCPYSTEKCESLSELDYEIQRCIDLGYKTSFYKDVTWVQYYNVEFCVSDNKIVSIERNEEHYFPVKESKKLDHYYNHYKVVV